MEKAPGKGRNWLVSVTVLAASELGSVQRVEVVAGKAEVKFKFEFES